MLGKTATLAALAFSAPVVTATPSEVEVAFKDFVKKYDRNYATPEEEKHRFNIFKASFEYINLENAKGKPFFLEINQFADQSGGEFNSTHFGLSKPSSDGQWGAPLLGTHKYSGAELPDSVDWVPKGAVTPAKNQGQCGSCWAFSTTGGLEGAWFVSTGKLVSLSEQQLVDCSSDNHGCNGGSMDLAFTFVEKTDMCTEDSYPYQAAANPSCQHSCDVGIPRSSVTGYYDVPPNDQKALMEAVAQQPVSVAIEADQQSFQMYGGGVLTKECGNKLDHGVLVVGYGTDNGVDYWKVKNSWGSSWGEDGFLRIERGLPGPGECGIKSMCSYPKVTPHGPSPSPPSPSPSPQPPSPSPSPDPSCHDKEDFCNDPNAFDPEKDCEFIPHSCDRTCGCCDSPPKDWCNSRSADTVVV